MYFVEYKQVYKTKLSDCIISIVYRQPLAERGFLKHVIKILHLVVLLLHIVVCKWYTESKTAIPCVVGVFNLFYILVFSLLSFTLSQLFGVGPICVFFYATLFLHNLSLDYIPRNNFNVFICS